MPLTGTKRALHLTAAQPELATALHLTQRQRVRVPCPVRPQDVLEVVEQDAFERQLDAPLEPVWATRLRLTVAEALLNMAGSAVGEERARLFKLTNSRMEALKPQRTLMPWRAETWRLIGDWHHLNGRLDVAAATWRQVVEVAATTDAAHQSVLATLALARLADEPDSIAAAAAALAALGAEHDAVLTEP